MNLVTRFLAARRDKLLMRLGCWLVCFSLVLGLMLPQQRAEALVAELTIGSVAALAASYLCACGLPLVTQGMDRDALVSSVQRLIQEFLDTELGGITIQDWLGNVWDLAVIAGKLIMGRPLTEEFVGFAQWVAGKYAVQVGENAVYDRSGYFFSTGERLEGGTSFRYALSPCLDTVSRFYVGQTYELNGHSVLFTQEGNWLVDGEVIRDGLTMSNVSFVAFYPSTKDSSFHTIYDDSWVNLIGWKENAQGWGDNLFITASPSYSLKILFGSATSESLGIDRAESMSYIPEGIEAEQGIALDVGAAATMDLDLVLQGVLDDVLAGELTSTMEVAGEAVVDPPADEITDVDNLGLPALGAALTSRFPFSIPWDFFRAVQLLAAPAKAPYFEVDFMEPLADDVGGWQGDTTVILDFSEYAIIGQISRWTSTIGFCLMLAGATKRLIWTA